MPSQLFEAKADVMNGGLDLNTDRMLESHQISGGASLRFERGSGIMTGPGYLLKSTPVAGQGFYGGYEANKIRPTGWAKIGTKIQYTHDGVTFYDTGVTVTASLLQAFLETPDGDI